MKPRHELKHRITAADCVALRQRLRAVARPDFFAGENGAYRVRSLYFDNFDDKALREKALGAPYREKFRLRTYNNDPSLIKLEKKVKNRGLCEKYGAALSQTQTQALLDGDLSWMPRAENALVLELYLKMHIQALRPKTIVDYVREAYIFPAGNVRVTMDSRVSSGLASTDFFSNLPLAGSIDPGIVILEVKYDEFLPDLIRDVVQIGDRRATSASKYELCRQW